MNVTICPAASDNPKLHFDKAQFVRTQHPVEAHYVGPNNGENGWVSTGLSFGDYNGMHRQTNRGSLAGGRRLATPPFMLDQARFRSVVLRYLEIRVQLRTEGTEVERLQKLTSALKRRGEHSMALIDEWALDYVTNASDIERKQLQRRIAEHDTFVRICKEPWVIPQMARCYYFEGLDSKAVGERVGFRAPHVRQVLYRLGKVDAEMQAGRSGFPRREARTLPRAHAGLGALVAPNLAIGSRRTAENESQHV
jgi:hypothetical protein